MKHLITLAVVCCTLAPALAQQPVDKDHAEKMARGTNIFKKHVRQVLINQCLKCHGGAKTEGELDITDRDRLLKGGDHGSAIVSGEPKKSLLYLMATHEKKPGMPYKEPKLSDEIIRQLASWIENGAPYDSPLVARNDTAAWIEKKIAPESRQHWAYRPLKTALPPGVKDEKWIKTNVDRFILAKLEERGIAPNSQVSKRVLIRRAYFDLI